MTCSLKNKGCVTTYSGTQLSMSSSMPFALTANNNVPLGYSETVCAYCTSGLQNVKLDNYVVTQNMDCGIAMVSKAPDSPYQL